MILIYFFQLFLKILEMTKAIPIPIMPPNVFAIRSVISVAPIAKINWMTSNPRLVKKMGMIWERNDFSCHKAYAKTPNGTKANTFRIISRKSIRPFAITDSLKGIRLVFLIWSKTAKEN